MIIATLRTALCCCATTRSNRFQVEYWMIQLGVSHDELTDAVREVGPVVADVERALGLVS